MIPKKLQKDAEYLQIIQILRRLRDQEMISEQEYIRAKRYYRSLLEAEMFVAN